MKRMITQEKLKELFDYRDGSLYWKVKPYYTIEVGDRAGYLDTTHGYIHVYISGKAYREHRLIWCWHNGNMPVDKIDHINGIKADNRIENLRECSQAENTQNKGIYKSNTVGLMGVTYNKQLRKYQAQIQVNKKKHHLGLYTDAQSAHNAYVAAKAELHTFSPTIR